MGPWSSYWRDRSLNADAFVIFPLDQDGKIRELRMEPISQPSDFSFDFQAAYRPEQVGQEVVYGFERTRMDREDVPGTSVFARSAAGEVFHTYSAYTNGGDMPLSLTYLSLLG